MKILVLGGGGGQIELIRYLKSLGHKVIVVSPYSDDPGIPFSDVFINEDIRNFDSIISSVHKLNIDGVTSDQSDVGALAQAYITQQLGLPGENYLTIERFCNKGLTYEHLQLCENINLPETHIFSCFNEGLEFIRSYPDKLSKLIVKPCDSQGSRGVKRLSSHELVPGDVKAAFRESKSNKILIQEFIDGSHFAVEAYVLNTEIVPLLISKKEKYSSNKNLDKRLVIFIPDNSPDIQLLSKTHKLIIQELGLFNGITHGEYIINREGKIYLIEIAARGAGANISSKVIKAITGFNSLHLLANLSLGIKKKPSTDRSHANFAIVHFIDFEVNESTRQLINETDIENLLHLEIFKRESGGEIKDSRDRLGYFIVTGNSILEAEKSESTILKVLRGSTS